MELDFKIQPDLQRLTRQLKGDVKGATRAGMINLTTRVEASARKNAPVRTANLANTGTNEVNADGTQGSVTFTAPYAGYVHQGTGLYGPHKTKIVPRGKRALYWPGAAHPVRSIRGMKGRPFLQKAAEESNMEALFTEGANNFLKTKGGI
jgi:HK97 gp10 family phage protein